MTLASYTQIFGGKFENQFLSTDFHYIRSYPIGHARYILYMENLLPMFPMMHSQVLNVMLVCFLCHAPNNMFPSS